LKKPATEASYISDCLQRLALGNPRLTLRYINNGKIVFQSTGSGDLKTVLLNIYGREVATKVISVDVESNHLRLHGLVGKPEIARGNRGYGTFIINGRYIQSSLLNKAIESAMHTMLPVGKFPLFTLNLDLPFDALDVNVHPTKMDVRFADEDGVFTFIEGAVRSALTEQNLIPSRRQPTTLSTALEPEQLPLPEVVPKREPATNIDKALEMFFSNSKAVSAKERNSVIAGSDPQSSRNKLQSKPITIGTDETCSTDATLKIAGQARNDVATPQPRATLFKSHQIHGLIFNTYWLITQNESLYLIDQHAAHERVLYENLLTKAREDKVPSQQLLIPLPLRLTPREKQILTDNKEIFQNFGFEITDDDNFSIESVPMQIKGTLQSGFFSDLLDKLGQAGSSKNNLHKTELIAVASCKAAVKSGDTITEAEARAMITQLMELENPFTCPHGRPTIIEITKQELERRFKRS